MDLNPEFLLNLGTHGVLLLVIIWQRVDINRMQDRRVEMENRLFDLLDKAERIIAQLDDPI